MVTEGWILRIVNQKRLISRGMKKALLLLGMVVFVAIQFADIAILDAAPVDGLEFHRQSDHDQDKQAFDGCEIHCGCHSLHHMAAAGLAAGDIYAALTDQEFPRDNAGKNSAGQGPPVPPPSA
jgi:hypothetical protein